MRGEDTMWYVPIAWFGKLLSYKIVEESLVILIDGSAFEINVVKGLVDILFIPFGERRIFEARWIEVHINNFLNKFIVILIP